MVCVIKCSGVHLLHIKMKIIGVFMFVVLHCSLAVVCASTRQQLLDYRRILTIPSECGKGELIICKNCVHLKQCEKIEKNENENDEYEEIHLKTCAPSESCITGVCKPDPNGECSPLKGKKFKCAQVGTFPDPADCKTYHTCNKKKNDEQLTTYEYTCPSDEGQAYGFNVKTLLCTDKLASSKCKGLPVPICTDIGQSGPLPLNPSYYYTCVSYEDFFYPAQRVCPFGQQFSSSKGCA